MGRRSITDEAQKSEDDQPSADESDSTEGAQLVEEQEEKRFTQRMPPELASRVDEYAEDNYMSRNAAINALADKALEQENR